MFGFDYMINNFLKNTASKKKKKIWVLSFFSLIIPRIRTEHVDLLFKCNPNAEKYVPEETLCLDTFHAMVLL